MKNQKCFLSAIAIPIAITATTLLQQSLSVTTLAQLSLTGHWLELGQKRGSQRMEIVQNGNVLNLLLSYPTGDYTQQATLSGNQFQFECKFNNPGSSTDFHYSYIGTFSTDGNIIDLTEKDKTGRNSNRNMRLQRTAEVQVDGAGSQPCSSELVPNNSSPTPISPAPNSNPQNNSTPGYSW
ncbi:MULTISPECIES: hypothetical protein [unclassified Microcoleus]|uniref:hypothetical protein n=1 Tax=unclassified Microcoleus TaxID=2642155 RepID=UPI002FCE8906